MTEEIDLARQLATAQKETKLAKLQLQKSNSRAQQLQQQLEQVQLDQSKFQQQATNSNPEVQQFKIIDLEIEIKTINEVLKQKNQNISNLQQQLVAKDEIINEMSNMNGQQPYNELLKSQIVQQQSQIKSLINTVKQVQPFTDEERQQLVDEIFQLKQELEKKEQQIQTKLFQEENDIQIMDFLDDTSDNKKIPPNTPADDGQSVLQIQEQSFLQRQLSQQIAYNQELSQQIQALKNQLEAQKIKKVEKHRQDQYQIQHQHMIDRQTPDMPSDQMIGNIVYSVALAPDVRAPEQPLDDQVVYQQAPGDDAPDLPPQNVQVDPMNETIQNRIHRHDTPVTVEYSSQKAASIQISPLKSSAVTNEQVMEQNKDVPQKLQLQIERLEQEIYYLTQQIGNTVNIPRKPQMKPPTTDINQLDQQIIKRQQEYLVSLLTYKNELNDCLNQSKDNKELTIQTLRFQLTQRDDNQEIQAIIKENMLLKQQLRSRSEDQPNSIIQENTQLKQQLLDVQHMVTELQNSQSRIQFDNESGQLCINEDMRLSKSRFEKDVKQIDSDNFISHDTILLQSKLDLQQNIIAALEQDIQELIERDISTRQENILVKSQLQQSNMNTSCDQQVFDLTMKEIQLQKQQLLNKLQEELNQRTESCSSLAVQHEQIYQYQSEIQQLKQTVQVQAAEIQLLYIQDNKQQVIQLQKQLQQVMELSQTREEVFQNQQQGSIPVQAYMELTAKFRAIEAECALLRKVNQQQLSQQTSKSPVTSTVIDVPLDYVDKKTRRMMEIDQIDVPVQSIEYLDKKTRKQTRILPNPGYDQV